MSAQWTTLMEHLKTLHAQPAWIHLPSIRRSPVVAARRRPALRRSPVCEQQWPPSYRTCFTSSASGASTPSPSAVAASTALQELLDVQSYAPAAMPAAVHDEQQQSHQQPLVLPPVDEWGADPWLMSGCEPGQQLRVAVLVSGGVDSSLALRLVTAAGHKAVAFYLQIWFQEDFRNFWDACPWEEDLAYAQQVCDGLGVELKMVPLTDAYWDRVVSESIAEIKAGRTPNPDILCNSRVKFGAFYEYLDQNHNHEFDRVASGHYARVVRSSGGGSSNGSSNSSSSSGSNSSSGSSSIATGAARHDSVGQLHVNGHSSSSTETDRDPDSGRGSSSSTSVQLMLTPDAVKDQTYFLAHLSEQQLSRVMFPLGPFTKPQVRQLATAAGLANSSRKDSQGICFLGKVKFSEFVKEHLGEWLGPIMEVETGNVLGVHRGYWFYTVGQRGGIKLPGGPWYVVRKDRRLNVVHVSKRYHDSAMQRRNAFDCGPFNWLSSARPDCSEESTAPLMVKVRHGPSLYACSLQLVERAQHGVLQPSLPAAADAGLGTSALSVAQAAGSQLNGHGSAGQVVATSASQPAVQQYGRVRLEGNDQGLAAGQYAVFYQGGVCLGSAKILEAGALHLDAGALDEQADVAQRYQHSC